MAGLAGIRAISSEQLSGAVTTGAHEDRSMPAEGRSDPFDPKHLPPIAVVDDLDAATEKAHVLHLWITEAVRIKIGAVIAGIASRRSLMLIAGINSIVGPWLGMPGATTI